MTGDTFIIVGDVHGDLNQFVIPLMEYLKRKANGESVKIIYVGDYIDRGTSDAYIVSIMNAFNDDPNVIFIRGNHEAYIGGTLDKTHQRDAMGRPFIVHNYIADAIVNNALGTPTMKMCHYEPSLQTLFTHSAHARTPMSDFEVDFESDPKKAIRLTISKDAPVRGSSLLYRNIHGHDHRASPSQDIQDFFKDIVNDTQKSTMISIDNDATYACSDNNVSRVFYLVVQDCRESAGNIICNEVRKTINIGTALDYNNTPLMMIGMRLGKKLSLEYSEQALRMALVERLPVITRESWNKLLKDTSDDITVSSHMYFQNVPHELYVALGIDNGSWKPTWILYHESVNGVVKEIVKGSAKGITGGTIINVPIARVLLLIISMVILVCIVIHYIKNISQMFDSIRYPLLGGFLSGSTL